MKLKKIKALLLIGLSLFCIATFQGCEPKDKEIIISDDVAQEIQLEESEVEALIREGQSYLDNKDFEKAKEAFEAAVNISVSDKDIYLRIKEKYVQVDRYDDGYYFINLAIKNNVDTENMNEILVEIRNNMETVKINCEAYINEVDFNLPDQVTVTIDGAEYTDYVVWSDFHNTIDELETYTFHGVTKEYGRNVIGEVKVKDLTGNKIGFVRDTYVKDDYIVIVYDEAQFYIGKEAITEAKKDQVHLPKYDDGEEYIPNGYYLRNSSQDKITIKVSKDAIIKIAAFLVDKADETTLPRVIDYETFKAYVDKNKDVEYAERALLFRTNINKGIVEELEMQFTP